MVKKTSYLASRRDTGNRSRAVPGFEEAKERKRCSLDLVCTDTPVIPYPGIWSSSQNTLVSSQQLAVPSSHPQGVKRQCSSLLGPRAKLDENECSSVRHLVALSTLLCSQALRACGCWRLFWLQCWAAAVPPLPRTPSGQQR